MAVPGTGQTVKMTNNGTGLVSPIPGYAETVSAVGRECVLSTEDGDKYNGVCKCLQMIALLIICI